MSDEGLLMLKGHEVDALLEGREAELLQTVRQAYETHACGDSSLPHSTFLDFPDTQKNRIIALPAYLGQGFGVAGVKWIASFPENVNKGLDRASAVIILNSMETGNPKAVLEGSKISAKRTAVSAVLAAQFLHGSERATTVGMIGCGLINFEVIRYLRAALPLITNFVVYDLERRRAESFIENCREAFGDIEMEVAPDVETALGAGSIVVLATTAVKPHIGDLSACAPGTTLLHISLRDLTPEIILSCDNVVDDIAHVCRAQTSLHLAEQMSGNRDFIRCTLADVSMGRVSPRRDAESLTVFSPFGLGVLDLAVSQLVYKLGMEQQCGMFIESFLPEPWSGNRVVPQ